MATQQEVINATINCVTTNPGAFSQVNRGFSEAAAGGVTRGVSRNAQVNNAIAEMFRLGFRGTGQALKNAADELQRESVQANQKIAQLQRELTTETVAENRHELERRIREEKKLLEEKEKSLNRRINAQMEAAERQTALLARADERTQRTWYQTASQAGEMLGSGVENLSSTITSGSIDPQNLASGLAQGLSGVGDVIAGKLAQGGFAQAAAGLSTAATALAGAAASIGAVVAVLAAAYGQMLELNEELTTAIAPVELAAEGFGNLKESLKQFREAAIDSAFALRMDTKEVITALGAFNSAGISLRELARISGNTSGSIKEMVGVTEMAIVASKGLGIEVSDFAGFLKNIQKLGGSLSDVQGSFGLITEGARRAGMTTKDFFTAINEASSGMALYNFRVGDTVGLFTTLTSILGEDLAKEKLGLQKTFAGMGFQERFQRVLTTGKDTTQKIFRADATRQAEEFANKFQDTLKGGPLFELLGGAGALDVEGLGNLTEKEFVSMLSSLRGFGGDVETNKKTKELAIQQLQTLRNISTGLSGGTSKTTTGFSGVSRLGELALELGAGKQFLGGKSLSEAAQDPILRSFLEQQMGLSGEELEANIRLDRMLRAKFEELIKDGKINQNADFFEELTKGTLTNDEDMKKIAERNLTTAERLGYDTLSATRGISQDIKNIIAYLLEKISGFVEYIASWLGRDDSEEKQKLALMQYSSDQLAKLNEDSNTTREEINKLKEELKSADEEGASWIKSEIADKEKELDRIKLEAKGERARYKAYSRRDNDPEAAYRAAIAPDASEVERRKIIASQNVGKIVEYNPDATPTMGMQRTLQREGFLAKGDLKKMDRSTLNRALQSYLQKGLEEGRFTTGDVEGMGGYIKDKKDIPAATIITSATTPSEDSTLPSGEWIPIGNTEEFSGVTGGDDYLTEEQIRLLEDMGYTNTESSEANVKTASYVEEMVKLMKESKREENLKSLMAATGLSRKQALELDSSQLSYAIAAGSGSAEDKKKARIAFGLSSKTAPVEDFIYRGNGITGTITPIDKSDEFFGAKPGGAIDKALNGGGVVINISGVGSAEEVARAVATTLKKMGYGNAKMYKN